MRGVGIVGNPARTPSTPPAATAGQLAQQALEAGQRADGSADAARAEQPVESQAPRRRLRVVTRCADIDEFMAAFAPFTDETSLFVVTTAPRPVGPRQPFVIQLRDGTSVLSGEGDVVESLHDPDAPVRGMRVRLLALDEDGRRMHEALLAHAASQVGGARGAAAAGPHAVPPSAVAAQAPAALASRPPQGAAGTAVPQPGQRPGTAGGVPATTSGAPRSITSSGMTAMSSAPARAVADADASATTSGSVTATLPRPLARPAHVARPAERKPPPPRVAPPRAPMGTLPMLFMAPPVPPPTPPDAAADASSSPAAPAPSSMAAPSSPQAASPAAAWAPLGEGGAPTGAPVFGGAAASPSAPPAAGPAGTPSLQPAPFAAGYAGTPSLQPAPFAASLPTDPLGLLQTPRAVAELPANPFQQLTDQALEAFVDCTLYEDRATSTGPLLDADVAQPVPDFEPALSRNAPARRGLRERLSFAEPWVAAGRLREAATRIDRRTAKIIGATVGATALVTLLLSYAMWGGSSEDAVVRAPAGAPAETSAPAPAVAPAPVVAASPVPVVTPAPCVATVRSEPPGAAVFFGGELAGRTPIDNAAVPCGPSLMAMEKDEYQRIEKRVEARNGKTLFLYNRMSRPAITLDVTTDPPNAKVAVRGRYLGRAPMSTVVPGFIEIEVVASMGGYKPAVTRMVVKPPTANAHLVLEPLKPPGG